MASQVEICNLALAKFGDTTITTITDATKEARTCKNFWNNARDELMSAYPWNFALKRAELAQLADAPDFGYDYAFGLPADNLRVWELFDSDADYAIEDGKLLTNDDTVKIRYISRVETTGSWPPAFCRCMSIKLAAEISPKLKGDGAKMREAFLAELEGAIRDAFALNAIEGKPTKHKDEQPIDSGNFTWQTEGR